MMAATTSCGFSEATVDERWRRTRTARATAESVRGILARADAAAVQQPSAVPFTALAAFAETGDRSAYVELYRDRRGRLSDLAIAALIEPERDTAALADLIWSTCDEYQWAFPAHMDGQLETDPEIPHVEQIDLSAAETAAAVGEIASLLEHRLPSLVVHRARVEIRRRVIDPFLARSQWWETAPTNWASVCAASVLLAGCGVLDDDEQARVTARVLAALDCYLSGFDEDGVCSEGVDYWNYGFGYFTAAAEALRERSGGDIDLWSDPSGRLARIARFPMDMRLSGDVVASFADTRPAASVDRGLLSRVAERVDGGGIPSGPDVPRPGDQRYRRWVLASRGLLWNAADTSSASAGSTGSTFFPHAQWLIVRDVGEIGFAARGGHNDELHNHNDIGSFIVAARGEVLLADPGLGVYDRDYFSPRRYDNPATGSHGHSVPIVDGSFQRGWAPDAAASVREIWHEGGRARFGIEYASAYGLAELRSLRRTWDYAAGIVTIDDAYAAARPLEMTFRHVSPLPILVTGPGRAEVRGENVSAELSFPAELPAETGTFGTDRGLLRPIHYLDLRCAPAAEGELRVTVRVRESGGSHGAPAALQDRKEQP